MITYEAEGVKFPNIKKRETSNWIRRVAESYGKRIGEIGYLFVNDDKILEVNKQYLGHDYYTDIITFDYTTPQCINGDVFISWETAQSNAAEIGVSAERELLRILAHGLLHLTGQGDKTPETKAEMTRKENQALGLF